MADLLVAIPVLNRPANAQTVADAVSSSTTLSYRILFLCSPDEHEEEAACRATGADVTVVGWPSGHADWAKKLNWAADNSTEEWMLLAADDVKPHPGWDTAAVDLCEKTGKCVIGTNDLGNREAARTEAFSTHPLIRRRYCELGTADGPGLLTTVYKHNFVDREFAETAASRDHWAYCRHSVVEHLHPNWRKAKMDGGYEKSLSGMVEDRALYLSRQPLWGGRQRTRRGRYSQRRTGMV